jgi:muramoyltetrapeptide carboxypeptidase
VREPKWISSGTIGVFAPASPFTDERFERGLAALRALGFDVHVHSQAHARKGFLAGSDEERVRAFHDLLDDPQIDAVMAARGGYGVHRILDKIDASKIRNARKPIIGFSDVCALHALVQGKGDLISIHGPVVTQLGELEQTDRSLLKAVLAGGHRGLRYAGDRAITGGRAEGTLVGGCLAVLQAIVGTPYLFLPSDAILLIEDVQEASYRIDRMLTHLRLAGVLSKVRGVAVGDFVQCAPQREGEQTVEEVLAERLQDLGVPVLAGLPFGHGKRNHAVPLGARVVLDADQGHLLTLG